MKLAEDKWTLKEMIGHLIDSASNNHQRFIRLQSGDLLSFPAYDGEDWIRVEKHNRLEWSALVALWYNYNLLLLNIIANVDDSSLGNIWVKGEDAIPLDELIVDYFRHIAVHRDLFEKRLAEVAEKL